MWRARHHCQGQRMLHWGWRPERVGDVECLGQRMLQWGWRPERVGGVEGKTSLSRPEDAAVGLEAREGWGRGGQDITVKARRCCSGAGGQRVTTPADFLVMVTAAED